VPPGSQYSFDPFVLDAAARRLTRDGAAIALADRHFDVLLQLVSHAGVVLSKDALVEAAWRDVAVTDNSLEQAVSTLRRLLGTSPDGALFIETVPRQGYRFAAAVTRAASRESEEALDRRLRPHLAWVEGRTALETLTRQQVVAAAQAFDAALHDAPDYAPAHVGAANALAFRFESTRADETPDTPSLARAIDHARTACRLDPEWAEAWATLGFVLSRAGRSDEAIASSRRATSLEPDNWRHHLRLAFVSWGEERLRAAHRTSGLLPGLALAHWLAATVYVARQSFDLAERELDAGADAQDAQAPAGRFAAVGLHWLRGLVRVRRADEAGGRASFARELSFEASGHVYARECCANVWYAIGALDLRRNPAAATAAFAEALRRVPGHPFAAAAIAAGANDTPRPASSPSAIDAAHAAAIRSVLAARPDDAAALVHTALRSSPPGPAGWSLPVDPILCCGDRPQLWAAALSVLRTRAA
jgi:DNA-binding winged helix-turn-helix (wHTH) protein